MRRLEEWMIVELRVADFTVMRLKIFLEYARWKPRGLQNSSGVNDGSIIRVRDAKEEIQCHM
jgi:hypothetical protein